jgi:pimeloyl-ACP methyl ester carboxylesterase
MQLEVISHQPESPSHHTPLLFVHGAWHGAWCWELFLPYFATYGYAAHAVSLRGHGQSDGATKLRWFSVSDYIADIVQVAQTLPAPPVLIGHSLGGYTVQKYLERYDAPAAILLASVPVSGILGFALRYARRHPWQFLKAQLRLNPWHLIGTPDLMREALFSPSLPAEAQARHYARLQAESFRMELDAVALALPRPKKITCPILVMAAANDQVFTVAEAQATARAYGTDAVIFPDMAHDMMLEPAWQQVADTIIGWLRERGF